MRIAMVGLGRMGANMTRRLCRAGHEVVVYDVDESAVDKLATEERVVGTATPGELAAALEPPRVVWLMVPAAVVDDAVESLVDHLAGGDVIIDGGNSHYRDAIDRAEALEPRDLHWVDVGVSGGVWGLESGYCLMIGGEDEVVERLAPVFRALAPGVEAAARTRGRDGEPRPAEEGWLHCGPVGAGHYVKMVHNGIEYGVMAAYAEGLGILGRADVGARERRGDAETAPLTDPRYHRFDLDVADVTEVWRRGSVIRSWLLDLTAAALVEDPDLDRFEGHVSDSGEGRWTVQAAVEQGVPAPVISTALYQRFSSRGNSEFADRVLSAMRREFGGHEERIG